MTGITRKALHEIRVVMVGPFPIDPQRIAGGVEASVYGIVTALQRLDGVQSIDVLSLPIKDDVRSSPPSDRFVGDKVRVRRLALPSRLQASSVLHLGAILKAIGADRGTVTHVHGSGLLQTALIVSLRTLRRPVVWTMHGVTAIETRNLLRARPSVRGLLTWLLYGTVERLALWLTHFLIVDTPYVVKAAGRRSAAVIPQGIADDVFAVEESSASARTIVSVGVLKPRKGHHLLIQAFGRAHQQMPFLKLRIVGSNADPAYVQELAATIGQLGLQSRVTLEPGLSRAEVLDALQDAAIYALHTQEESQCIAVCEAMAAGRPVVATAVGGLPHVVPADAGVLIPFGDVTGMGDALARLMAAPDERSKMGAAGRGHAERYKWPVVAEAVFSVYLEALGQPLKPQ